MTYDQSISQQQNPPPTNHWEFARWLVKTMGADAVAYAERCRLKEPNNLMWDRVTFTVNTLDGRAQ